MNQILAVEPPNKNKKSNKSGVHSILIVFAIILMIFGIGVTTTGAYSYYREISNKSDEGTTGSSNSKPIITVQRESASLITIVVTHDKQIRAVTYTINNEEPVQISGEGKSEVKEEVELPVGSSSIVITAEDANGISSSYETSFEVEEKPSIELEEVDGQIQATVKSNIGIDRVAYYWDEDTESREMITVNDMEYVTLIDVLEGTHTLNVAAIDVEGNTAMASQKIIGATKPVIDVKSDGQNFNIKVSDSEGLAKIEMTLNTNEMITEEISGTEYSKDLPLEDGENLLTVTVYNKNGMTETSRVSYIKKQQE